MAFIYIAGTYFLPNKQLHQPRASTLLRKIDEAFVAKLQKDMEMEPERNYGIAYVLVKDCSRENFKPDKLENYEYEVLGGLHNTTAANTLHDKYPDNPHFKGRYARVYCDLSPEEALWIASRHSMTAAMRHEMTFLEEVGDCIYCILTAHLQIERCLFKKKVRLCIDIMPQNTTAFENAKKYHNTGRRVWMQYFCEKSARPKLLYLLYAIESSSGKQNKTPFQSFVSSSFCFSDNFFLYFRDIILQICIQFYFQDFNLNAKTIKHAFFMLYTPLCLACVQPPALPEKKSIFFFRRAGGCTQAMPYSDVS